MTFSYQRVVCGTFLLFCFFFSPNLLDLTLTFKLLTDVSPEFALHEKRDKKIKSSCLAIKKLY